jgi:hypothetical protein
MMTTYYISRILIAWIFAALFYSLGAVWWMALLVGAALTAWFLYAPRSGRYQVDPQRGVTALQRDERAQSINDKAARNAAVLMILALGALNIYFGTISEHSAIPIEWTSWLLAGAAAVYLISDLILRQR